MAMRFIIMLLGISLSCFPMKSQDKVFFADSQFWDFGTIKEAGGMVEHVFRLRNVGKAPEKSAAASTPARRVRQRGDFRSVGCWFFIIITPLKVELMYAYLPFQTLFLSYQNA